MVTSAVVKAEANAVVAKAKPKDKAAVQVKAKKANTAGTTNALKADGKADVKAANSLSFMKIPVSLKSLKKQAPKNSYFQYN